MGSGTPETNVIAVDRAGGGEDGLRPLVILPYPLPRKKAIFAPECKNESNESLGIAPKVRCKKNRHFFGKRDVRAPRPVSARPRPAPWRRRSGTDWEAADPPASMARPRPPDGAGEIFHASLVGCRKTLHRSLDGSSIICQAHDLYRDVNSGTLRALVQSGPKKSKHRSPRKVLRTIFLNLYRKGNA